MVVPKRKCPDNHDVEVRQCDLSQAYGNEKYKNMWQVRCAVPANTCEFGDYFFRKLDAVYQWNSSGKGLL